MPESTHVVQLIQEMESSCAQGASEYWISLVNNTAFTQEQREELYRDYKRKLDALLAEYSFAARVVASLSDEEMREVTKLLAEATMKFTQLSEPLAKLAELDDEPHSTGD